MEDLWRADYERADVGVAPFPRQDTSSPDLKPGKFLEGREYLFPRRDFVSRGTGPELRARMVAENVMTLDDHFRNLTLAEILGSVDAGDLRPAYRRVVPVDFLRGIAISGRRQFMQEMFNPATAGTLFTNNVDDEVSFRSTDGISIGDFLLHQDDNGVLLGSTRIDISKKISPDQLRGYSGGTGTIGPDISTESKRPGV